MKQLLMNDHGNALGLLQEQMVVMLFYHLE
jgi:hypothetical protein